MAKRIFFDILTVLLIFTMQTVLFPHMAFGGIKPNLLLAFIISYGLIRGEISGMLFGFFCGLLNDAFYMDVIGVYALIYLFIGYLAGLLHQFYNPHDVRLPLFSIFAGDLIYSFVYYVLFFLLNGKLNFGYYFFHIILAELVYTIVLFIALYPLLNLLEQKVISVKLWSKEKDV
ncbi:MAG: rod shape-determining protein MreD [Lachnospiraceae bacterium]